MTGLTPSRLAIPMASLLTALLVAGSPSPDRSGPTPPVPAEPVPLDRTDPQLQAGLERAVRALGLQDRVEQRRLGVALVDLSRPGILRYAGLNDDVMMYAASLPKIAVLLTAFDRIEAGELRYTPQLRRTLTDMIRHSSNRAATRAIRSLGFDAIAACLQKDRYGFYEPDGSGGLWVGKAYDAAPAVRRDPLFGISHGATPRQAVRFFVMLDRGQLVNPEHSREMLRMLSEPAIQHKFVKGLAARPDARIYRKSGTWRDYHSDAALIERDRYRYAAAALVQDPQGGRILERLIVALDDVIRAVD